MAQNQNPTQKEALILNKREYGDISHVAVIMGVSKANAAKILNRPKSKRHEEAKRILIAIIQNREKLKVEVNAKGLDRSSIRD